MPRCLQGCLSGAVIGIIAVVALLLTGVIQDSSPSAQLSSRTRASCIQSELNTFHWPGHTVRGPFGRLRFLQLEW